MNKRDYYNHRLIRHREALDYSLRAIEQGIRVAYHTEQANYHKQKIQEIQEKGKTAKDLGPLSGVPQSGASSGLT